MSQHFISIHFLLLLLILLCTTTTTTLAQPAPAPGPPGPTNITKILEKAGQFTTLIRLLAITNVGDQIKTQLNNSKQGMTILAPTDNAFSALSAGTLNSLNDQQKDELIQFHVIPTFLATSQFQTLSNPIRTQAGDSTYYKFPLNITTSSNSVNITTGVVNATLANSIYSDGSLAVYQVDKVLLPMSLFGPQPPAAAPAPEPVKDKKKTGKDDTAAAGDGSAKANSGVVFLRGDLHAFIPGVFALIGMIYF
ncbi:FAS1 domain-containing protein [Artemisia annua]|uniref:FAS1 domain-containing protein n=1 Tax=Artemisia annua TaxID=35608 RepID=A0A2U1N6B9_ARTAN|nr:FAS1 domain-containing protein [Artemisia annua]